MNFSIEQYLQNLPVTSGVYKFFDKDDSIIYIGKAINLKARVSSYFNSSSVVYKTQVMVGLVVKIEFIVTANETEALLLENNLIYEYKPVFNIKLKDTKAYPYIYIDNSLDFARIFVAWQVKSMSHLLKFGPFTSKLAAYEVVDFVQSILQLRSCSNSMFKNRARPCVLYEIKQCCAPCVNAVDKTEYAEKVRQVIKFLSGNTKNLKQFCIDKMELAASKQYYELAGFYRDKLKAMSSIGAKQVIDNHVGDYDIYVAVQVVEKICVASCIVRSGKVIDQNNIIVTLPLDQSIASCINRVIIDNYLNYQVFNLHVPNNIIVNHIDLEQSVIASALSNKFDKKVIISKAKNKHMENHINLAINNAEIFLSTKVSDYLRPLYQHSSLQKVLNVKLLKRVECFDISHFQGDCTVGACVVFNNYGQLKSDYRYYNLSLNTKSDDYEAIYLSVSKRYKQQNNLPDLIIIDGGVGQLKSAVKALEYLGLVEKINVMAVSKGVGRIVGNEKLHFIDGSCLQLAATDPALHCIQIIRDAAHNYAISIQRKKMQGKSLSSIVMQIPGIGNSRKKLLLNHFIDIKSLKQASIAELNAVPGISKKLAQVIYNFFH